MQIMLSVFSVLYLNFRTNEKIGRFFLIFKGNHGIIYW